MSVWEHSVPKQCLSPGNTSLSLLHLTGSMARPQSGGTGEMVQQLRTCTILKGDLSLVPIPEAHKHL